MFGSRKRDEARLSCLLHLSLVGYEPKTTLVLLIAMERRVEVPRSAGEEKSAEEQLNDLVVEAAGSGGLEPRPAEFLGGVTATTARSGESSSGDLLRGLIPATSSGSVLEGMQPGVRRVEVVGLQGDRAAMNVDASMPTGPPRSYGPERGVEGVLGSERNDGTRQGERGSQDGRPVSTTPYPSSLEDPVGNFGSVGGIAPDVMVNPFWSPERRALERLHYGEFGFGSVGKRSTPETPPAYVEMDPIELFRLKCYREAEEKFRAGLSGLGGGQRSPASFASVEEPSSESYPPRPPPGPPPASPPKMVDQGLFWKPPPPPPPLPSFPSWGHDSGTGGSRNGMVGENPNETLRTFDLPRLDEEFSSLEFGDWLSMVDSQMGDISYTSSVWWGLVKGSVDQCYREWLQQGPIDRLRMKPVLDPRASQWPRTERRALAILLQSIPECIRGELVSMRRLTPDQLLFKLFCVFQPGGSSERTKLLQCISEYRAGDSVKDMLSWVRTWRRYVGRALELGLVIPDPLVLVGVLQRGSDLLSQVSPQVAYRLNTMRQQLSLDQQPSTDSVMAYSEYLQAEAEELVLAGLGGPATPPKNPPKPSVKMLGGVDDFAGIQKPPGLPNGGKGNGKTDGSSGGAGGGPSNSGSVTSTQPCKYWGSNDGCRRADKCKFVHGYLNPRDNRCFNCSAVGHSKKDCPQGKKKIAKAKGDRGENEGKGKDSPGKGPPKNGSPPESSSSNSGVSGPAVESGAPKGSGKGEGENRSGDALGSLMEEAAALMKSLRPKVKVVQLRKARSDDLATGLLDGGATNALRQGTADEIKAAVPVDVELAAGTAKLFQSVETGTLLSVERVEPIVPLRGLVSLGYKIRWDDRGCLIFHPQVGRIRCWLRNGCPVVVESHALSLIRDIEEHEKFKRLGPKLAVGKVSDAVKDWWNKRYPEVPDKVLDFMVGQEAPPQDGSGLPWNRRFRKRVERAKAVVIHLFSGSEEDSKLWGKGWPPHVEVITVDIRQNSAMDLHLKDVWGYLCHVARTKRILAIIGGPPCRTVSRLRLIQPGPRPLRNRVEGRFGLEGLTPSEELKVDGDSALLLKQVALHRIAEESRVGGDPEVGFFLESPEDPAEYTPQKDSPTFWVWPEVTSLIVDYNMRLISFDQGRLGHSQRKPTSSMTNLKGVFQVDEMRCIGPYGEGLHPNLDKRMEQTAAWSTWAPGLKQLLRSALSQLLVDQGLGDESLRKAFSRDQWVQHFRQQHHPFRGDCKTCIMNMASDKPHRRRRSAGSSAWSMGVDIVPLVRAKDEATGEYVKNVMVATLLVPKFLKNSEDEAEAQPSSVEASPGVGEDGPVKKDSDDCFDSHPESEIVGWGEGLSEADMAIEGEFENKEENPQVDVADSRVDPNPQEDKGKVDGVSGFESELQRCAVDVQIQHLTVVFPMSSRATADVIHALNVVTTRFRSMGLFIDRIHSDKARELVSKPVQRWMAARQIKQTSTSGDDPASAGHVESEVHQLKRRVRLHLKQAGKASDEWPCAVRYAAEERLRNQLSCLGVPTLPMIPFFVGVLVKRKRWHDRGPLAPPFVSGRLLCPSHLMNQGWLVKTDDDQIVHVREAIVPSPISEEVAQGLANEPVVPLQLEIIEHPGKPPHRLYEKQPMPGDNQPHNVGFVAKREYSPSIAPAEPAGGESGEMEDFDLNFDDPRVDGENGVGEKKKLCALDQPGLRNGALDQLGLRNGALDQSGLRNGA